MSGMRFWKVAIQIAGLLVFIGCFASTGSAQCIVSVTPHAVIFGPQAVGVQSPVITVTFSVLGGSPPCTLNSFPLLGTPAYFSAVTGASNGCVTPVTMGAGGSCTVDTTFTPTVAGGGFHTFLTFNYTDGVNPRATSISVDGGDTLVYVATQTASQIVKVDPVFSDFAVVFGPPGGDLSFSPEGMVMGPDNKLYTTDSAFGRIWRLNQDGTQFEKVYDVSHSGAAGPLSPRGPSFSSSSSGDLYFTSDWNESDCVGVFRITGVGTTVSIPTPLTPTNVVNGTCPGSSGFFQADSGRDTAFDSSDYLNFDQTGANGSVAFREAVLSVNLATYTAGSNPNIVAGGPATPLNSPYGIALNKATGQMFVADKNSGGFGEILAIGSGGATSVYYTFGVNGNGSNCGNLNDLPTLMQFDGLGNLYVVTSTDPTGLTTPSCGALWLLSPPCSDCGPGPSVSMILDFYQASTALNAPLNGSQAMGVAFQSSGTQSTPQKSAIGASSATGGSFTKGWPVGCVPAPDGTRGNCSHTYGLTYTAGMFGPTATVTVVATETSQMDWKKRTPMGSPYAGTNIAPIAGYGGNGVIYTATCTATNMADCTPLPTNYYTTTSAWHSTDTAWCTEAPQMLKSEASAPNTLVGVLIDCKDGGPTHHGGSGPTLSDWANVKGATGTAPTINFMNPFNGAVYNQNSPQNYNFTCSGQDTNNNPIVSDVDADSDTDCFGGPDLVNGTATVQNGSPIDTSRTGTYQFQVTADVNSGPGASTLCTLPSCTPPTGFTNVLLPQTVTYMVVAGPQASVTPANVNFGTFYVPGIGLQFVKVTNTGTAPLSISSVKVTSVAGSSDDFFAFSLCPKTLDVRKSCYILVTFFADEVPANNTDSANLTVTDNASGGSTVIPLSATVLKRIKH